jgi:molybdopterin/thiamine biosynthesis adenylyltransferase
MPVLDMLSRDRRITRITLIEPDIYKPHNTERHVFPPKAIEDPKAELARDWLLERRSDLKIDILTHDLMDPANQKVLEEKIAQADIGICAADNEPAKYHWDVLMRRHRKPWTLGEVLSGGIGGFVHYFVPGGACYGCVAGYLQRSVVVDHSPAPDYSAPSGPAPETTIPASMASIHAIAALHALITLGLLEDGVGYNPGFTSLLLTLRRVPEVFDEAFRPFRFRIPRSPDCLVCRESPEPVAGSSEDLDVALDQALARLGNA